MFGVLSLHNEPICSKSNYPFYFLTLNHIREYVHYPLPQATPRATEHIKRALWRGWDPKRGEGPTEREGIIPGLGSQCGGSRKSGVERANTKGFRLERTEQALRARLFGKDRVEKEEWRQCLNRYSRAGPQEERQRPELILTKNKLRHSLIKILKCLKWSPCFHSLKRKLGKVQIPTQDAAWKWDIRYPSNYICGVVR